MEPNETALLHRWRRGDAAAATEVVHRYSGALGAVAYSLLGDSALAEDAVQETFTRASARLEALNGVTRLGPWLLGIARHAALDARRKRLREVPLDGQERAIPATSPDGEASRAELREGLRQAVDGLPEDQREVFAMKYVGGLSYAEIAAVTGTTPEAVGQKLWRIRQKLQQELKEFRP